MTEEEIRKAFRENSNSQSEFNYNIALKFQMLDLRIERILAEIELLKQATRK